MDLFSWKRRYLLILFNYEQLNHVIKKIKDGLNFFNKNK